MKTFFTLLILFVFSLPSARAQSPDPGAAAAQAPQPAGAPAPAPDPAYQKAVELREAGRLDEAESILSDALHLKPESAGYHFELANIYAARHDLTRTKKETDETRGMLDRVARELEQAVMLDPSFVPAKFNLGVTYKRLARYEKAREILREVADEAHGRNDPGVEFSAVMQLGAAYEEQGFYDEAEEMYKKAKTLDFYNTELQGKFEDLQEEREMAQKRDSMEGLNRAMMSQALNTVPFSRTGTPTDLSDQGRNSQGSAMQALPYLGSMIAQQFMNRGFGRNRADD